MKCTQQTYAYDPYSVRVTRVTSFWQSLHRSVWYVQDVYLQRALVLPVLDAELLWIFTSPFSADHHEGPGRASIHHTSPASALTKSCSDQDDTDDCLEGHVELGTLAALHWYTYSVNALAKICLHYNRVTDQISTW